MNSFSCSLSGLVISILSLIPVAVNAQECNPVSYMRDQVVLNSYSDKLSYLHNISAQNWSEQRKNIAGGVTLPFEVPINARGSYEDFSRWRNDYFSQIHYTRDIKDDYVFHQSAFDQNSLQGYLGCLSQNSRAGLFAYATYNNTLANLHVSWSPGPKVDAAGPDAVTVHVKSTGLDPELDQSLTVRRGGEAVSTVRLREDVPVVVTAELVDRDGSHISAVPVNLLLPRTCENVNVTREEKMVRQTGWGNGDQQGLLPSLAYDWEKELVKKGYTNVHVEYLGKVREEHKGDGPNGNWHSRYNYWGDYRATYATRVPGPGCYGQYADDVP